MAQVLTEPQGEVQLQLAWVDTRQSPWRRDLLTVSVMRSTNQSKSVAPLLPW